MDLAGPFREGSALETLRAPSRGGEVVLEVAPAHVALTIGARLRVVVAGRFPTLQRPGKRSRRRALALDRGRLAVARGVPTRELALWFEGRAGQVERLVGVRPLALLDEAGLVALRQLDALAARLAAALAPHGHGAEAAVELGRGQHRVLVVEHAERLVVYARPLFRERPRRVLEVGRDGSLVVVERAGDRRTRFDSRYAVTASGDRIRFAGPDGDEVAALFLPWIAPEDRAELASRFADLAYPAPAEPHIDDVAAVRSGPRRRPIARPYAGLGGWRPGQRGLPGR